MCTPELCALALDVCEESLEPAAGMSAKERLAGSPPTAAAHHHSKCSVAVLRQDDDEVVTEDGWRLSLVRSAARE